MGNNPLSEKAEKKNSQVDSFNHKITHSILSEHPKVICISTQTRTE